MRIIGYNNQTDNITANGLTAYSQCFSTCAWMFMSHYTENIKAEDDNGLYKYVMWLETKVGPDLARKDRSINGQHLSLFWLVQKHGIKDYLYNNKCQQLLCFEDGSFPIAQLPDLVIQVPVIIGTQKIGNLPGGHIILLTDYDKETNSFIVNDPFGNATTNYKDRNGNAVLYEYDWLKPFINTGNNKCRLIYAN